MVLSLKNEKPHEILHYKKYIRLKEIIKEKNPNIVLHGVSKSGKSFLINYIMKNLYGESKVLNEGKITYKENLNYFIFDFSNNLKNVMVKKIAYIIKNYDHFNETIKYIVIDNFNQVSDIIQKNIKVFLEKFYLNSRFIFLTNKLFSIDSSIRDNCFNIKLESPCKYDKYIYYKYHLKKENIKFNDFLLLKYCEKYDIDRLFKIYYEDIFYIDVYDSILKEIIDMNKNVLDLTKVKSISMRIKELNLDVICIFTRLLDKTSSSINKLLIKEISHHLYIIKNSYRDIIYIEALLVKIYQIINYG